MIERVEIVRNGGSTLYGSNAIAGTVNIITKKPEKNNFYFSTNQAFIKGGSPDRTYMLGANVVNENQKTGASIYSYRRERTQWDANGDGFSEIGLLESNSFGFKSFAKFSRLNKLILQGYSIHENRRGGNKFEFQPFQTDITEMTKHLILNGGFTFEQFTSNLKHKFSVYSSLQKINRDSYYGSNRDTNAYGRTKDFGLVSGIQYTGKLGRALGGKHALTAGVEYIGNLLEDNAPAYQRIIKQNASIIAFYLQDNYNLNSNLYITPGIRLDKHTLLKRPVLSPRVNLLYRIRDEVQLRAGYARGFRAPQVFDEDLHITQVGGGGTVVTNANDLTAEFSNALSTSIDYNRYLNDFALGLTFDVFYNQLQNAFILEELGSDGSGNLLLERRNGEGAKVAGLNFHPKLIYKNKIHLELSFTFQNSQYDAPVQWSEKVQNQNRRFFRTPNAYGFYVLSWHIIPSFSLHLSGVYTGGMVIQHYQGYIEEDRLEKTSSFLENNFKLQFQIPNKNNYKISLSAGIQNYTNAFQSDFDKGVNRDSGYIYGPARPRTYFLGLNLHFR
jgi:outer membrane receptor for ferrienterochelin and colicins